MKNIKFILLICLFGFCIVQKSSAQTRPGVLVGANFAQLTGEFNELDEQKPRFGVYGGFLLEIPTGYLNYIDLGIFYSQQGAKFNKTYAENSTTINYSLYHKLDYLMIPLLWKQSFGEIYTKAGPYAQMLIQKESYWVQTNKYRDSTITESEDIESFAHKLRNFDIGGTVGIGYQRTMSDNFDFVIDFTMNFGLLKINAPERYVGKDARNRFFTLSTGIIVHNKNQRYKKLKRR